MGSQSRRSHLTSYPRKTGFIWWQLLPVLQKHVSKSHQVSTASISGFGTGLLGPGGETETVVPTAALSNYCLRWVGAPSRAAKVTTRTVDNCWECGFSISVQERKLIFEHLGSLCCCNLELNNCIHCRGCSSQIPTRRHVALMPAELSVGTSSDCFQICLDSEAEKKVQHMSSDLPSRCCENLGC